VLFRSHRAIACIGSNGALARLYVDAPISVQCTARSPPNGSAVVMRTAGGRLMRFRHAVAALAGAAAFVSAHPALANHNHPAKANKFVAFFVRSMQQCATPTHTHNPPLSFPACNPASAATSVSFGPKGLGQATGVVVLNSLKQASDVKLIAKFSDVRDGDDGTGTGFSGNLTTSATIRTTDHNCDGGANNPCTLIDIPFPVPLACGTAASPPLAPGKCAAKTTANAVVPGAIIGGTQANIGLGQLTVSNGPDLVFEEGLFLP